MKLDTDLLLKYLEGHKVKINGTYYGRFGGITQTDKGLRVLLGTGEIVVEEVDKIEVFDAKHSEWIDYRYFLQKLKARGEM